jgi:hypothetical protein
VLGVEVYRLQANGQFVSGAAKPLIPLRVKGKVAFYEAREVCARIEMQDFLAVTDPSVELGSDEVKILGSGGALAFANALRILTAKSRLDAVRILVFPHL